MVSQDRINNLVRAVGWGIALLISITSWSSAALAAGQSCDLFSPCTSSKDYCSAPFFGTCFRRGNAGDSCGVFGGGGKCKTGLVCDFIGECRHSTPRLGEPCGAGVPCVAGLGCSATVGGRCEKLGNSGDACGLIRGGECKAGLVCDFIGECRHSTPKLGEPCGAGVPCVAGLGCSADIGGRCEPLDVAGEQCSGIGQGSCASGLVCDFLRVCRHDPPQLDEPCGLGVPCADGFFCQAGSQRCKRPKTVGEGCSAFNPCREGLSCEPCFVSGCDYPLQCFPNANRGAITEQQCRTLYSPAQHQAAKDTGLAMTYASGNGFSAGFSEAQEFGVAYGADGRYGCFTSLCIGANTDLSISAFVSVGFYEDLDAIAGSSTAFVESAGIALASFSTSQIFARNSADVFDIQDPPIGTENALALTFSPEDIVVPISAGVYGCETELDTVIGGGSNNPSSELCGDGVLNASSEGCDDGNLTSGDGCSAACVLEAGCGDGDLNAGESCDDGNLTDGDGCSAFCTIEPYCGDGNLDLGEQCDDGNLTDDDGCSARCTTPESLLIPIQGKVRLEDGTPLCAMVLANGQFMFSCGGEGAYSLAVPLDANGRITLFAFADGFAPFSVTLDPSRFPFDVQMSRALPGSPLISLARELECTDQPDRIRISGSIESYGSDQLCAMVLSNGQQMFTCAESLGRYDLTIPVDQNGQGTIFGFADGFQPFSETFLAPVCDTP